MKIEAFMEDNDALDCSADFGFLARLRANE